MQASTPFNSWRKQVMHVKDSTDKLKKCGDVSFIQFELHWWDCRKASVPGSRERSAAFEHCRATGHKINPQNVKVLTTEDRIIKRRVRRPFQSNKGNLLWIGTGDWTSRSLITLSPETTWQRCYMISTDYSHHWWSSRDSNEVIEICGVSFGIRDI